MINVQIEIYGFIGNERGWKYRRYMCRFELKRLDTTYRRCSAQLTCKQCTYSSYRSALIQRGNTMYILKVHKL